MNIRLPGGLRRELDHNRFGLRYSGSRSRCAFAPLLQQVTLNTAYVGVNVAFQFAAFNHQALVHTSFKPAAKLRLNRITSVRAEHVADITPPQFQVRVHARKWASHTKNYTAAARARNKRKVEAKG